MRSVDVRTLKARASELLHAVEQGETIVITRRGRPVARLDGATGEPEQGMRLRGLLADLGGGLEAADVVKEVRELREESTSQLERNASVDSSGE